MSRKHRIAVLPGDGIGKETVPESLKVLDAAARKFGFDLELTHYDWSCETFKETGVFNADTARRFVDSILSRGGSRDALDAFIEFRGRAPDIQPLLDMHGIAA